MNTADELRSIHDDSAICLSCGACCGYFRVSFYWAEADDSDTGITPALLTEPVSPFLRCMRGTNNATQCRCCALTGEIGQAVSCNIYDQRPSTCREFHRNGENGAINEACNRARVRYGLSPLTNTG